MHPAGGEGGGDGVLRHAVGDEWILGGDPLDPGAVEPEQMRHEGLRRLMGRAPWCPRGCPPLTPHPGAGQREAPRRGTSPTPGHASYAVMY
ncbi:hypothetical protein C0Q59_03535 [Streptomyces albidoflavus]|nr:hypothetical protein C0Q59_03535 [Streptomyces albidoflavus]